MSLRFSLYAVGVLAPGVASLPELFDARGGVAGTGTLELAPPAALPANERRRATQVVRLAMACAEQALRASPFAAGALRVVCASDEGTGEVCQLMLEALATTGQLSPLLFHNSVHNAPSGYLSIAYRNRRSATSMSLGPESFAAGLLCAASEACASAEPVLFLAYDALMTEPMDELLALHQASACAWIIASGAPGAVGAPALAAFELSLHAASGQAQAAPPGAAGQAWWGNSSARGFEALALLDPAQGRERCELRLGAQWLRISCLERAVPC